MKFDTFLAHDEAHRVAERSQLVPERPEFKPHLIYLGFPGGSVVKNPPANAGDIGLIPGSGRSSGEGNGKTLQ